jgi:hypothetical protein
LPYRYDEYGRYGPFLGVGLAVNGHHFDMLCLVDTGAERTLLDGQHLRIAGVDIYTGKPVKVGGFLGPSLVVYEHAVHLVVQEVEISMRILFAAQPLERVVLGRDFLGEFRFGLREGASELFLGDED